MTAPPFGSFSYRTSLRPEEATAALRGAVDSDRGWFRRSTLPWIGVVYGSHFRIRRNIVGHNSFLPVLNGRIDWKSDGSVVKVHLRLTWSVMLFIFLFLLVAIQLRTLGLLALILAVMIFWVGWFPEVRRAENTLKEIIPPYDPEILPPQR